MSRRPALVHSTLAALLLLISIPDGYGQEIDVREIFSNDRFYEEHGIGTSEGALSFLADTWTLPGPAGEPEVLIGIGLSNSALHFVRTDEGRWRSAYSVAVRLEGEGEAIERSWDRTVDVASFDETLLTGETIVFQATLEVPPGEYDFTLRTTDQGTRDSGVVETRIEVPEHESEPALGPPVLLKVYHDTAEGVEWVVHPSHFYESAPDRLQFLVQVGDVLDAGPLPYAVRAVLYEALGDDASEADSVGGWSGTLSTHDDGTARAFASMSDLEARFGEFTLRVMLENESGDEIARSQTSLLVAGSSAWIVDNWDDALSLIKYEATSGEIDILEDLEDPEARIAGWNCFWKIRDPIPATATNEAFRQYLTRVQTANEQWTSTLRPGYLSDRGRVYITLGAPDQIDRNPFPRGSHPFEVWRYERGRQFEIVFTDRIGFNNYQLASLDAYQRELRIIDQRKAQLLSRRADQCPLLEPAFE